MALRFKINQAACIKKKTLLTNAFLHQMKVNMRGLDRRNVLISLCIVHLLALSEGRPVR